jgi:hypothetical protein
LQDEGFELISHGISLSLSFRFIFQRGESLA